jgi:hypothetical protein
MFNKVNSSLVAAMNFGHTSFSNLSLTWLFITPASDAFLTKSLSIITAMKFGHTAFTLKSDLDGKQNSPWGRFADQKN